MSSARLNMAVTGIILISMGKIEDGLYGPIIIHPRPGIESPFHMISSNPDDIQELVAAERRVSPLVLADLSHIPQKQSGI